MISVQERLQLKRTAVDKWSIREHLCLASAVSCSGDQNWMSVSRTLKMLCGANRPPDWFSQKSCAVQFNEILENVETPKRKKRTASERDNQNQTAETPIESIHRKLTQERVTELKIHLQQEQQEYAALREEYMAIQSGAINDDEIREIWAKIEREKEQTVLEQQKYALWLKEREERKLELQRAWRPGVFSPSLAPGQQSPGTPLKPLTILKSDDMDIDETISPVAKQQQQQQLQQQQGTSPLLTSLLKSQSSGNSGQVQAPVTSTTARIVAPTITNLLTGGTTTPAQIQPLSIIAVNQSQLSSVHSQPLTGPPIQMIPQQPKLLQSPSQEAPTLSSLLETTSGQPETPTSTIPEIPEKSKKVSAPPDTLETDDTIQNTSNKEMIDVFDNLIEENINELAEMLTSTTGLLPELLDQDLENVDLDEDDSQDEQFLDIDKDLLDEVEELELANNELENSKNIIEKTETSEVEKQETVKLEETVPENAVTSTVIDDVTGKNDEKIVVPIDVEQPIDEVEKTTELNESVTKDIPPEPEHIEEVVEEGEKEIPEIKEEIKIEEKTLIEEKEKTEETNLKLPEEDDDKNTEISEDSVDVTFQELAMEINEKIKAEVGQESKESTEDMLEILTDNIQSVPSTESDDKKSILTNDDDDDTQDMQVPEDEEPIKPTASISEHSNDVHPIIEKSSSESSDVMIVAEVVTDSVENEIADIKPSIETLNVVEEVVKQPEEKAVAIVKEEEPPKVKEKSPKPTEPKLKKVSAAVVTPEADIVQQLPDKQPKSIIEAATTITIIDTDEDSTNLEPTTAKDEKMPFFQSSITSRLSLSRRDYSRKKSEPDAAGPSVVKKKSEEPEETKHNLSVRKLRDNRDGSESPLVDDEMIELPRTRRRCSSTPVIDSIPNSPASSSDASDHKAWKKSMLIAYNRLVTQKNAAIFLRQFTEEQAPKFKQICYRPMDLQTIKRNIENGVIRTTAEFQRDVMLVCQNAMMYYKKNSTNYNAAKDIMSEIVAISELITEKDIKKEKEELIIPAPKLPTPSIVIASTGNPPLGVSTPNTTQSSAGQISAAKSRSTGSRKSLRLP